MGKILFLEKRGCDFFSLDRGVRQSSDVGNYRVGSYDYSIYGKNGRDYCMEFSRGDKYRIRTLNKRTGEKLKHPVTELCQKNALCVSISYKNNEGTWEDIVLKEEISKRNYTYTLKDILRCVNEISVDEYTEIQFV